MVRDDMSTEIIAFHGSPFEHVFETSASWSPDTGAEVDMDFSLIISGSDDSTLTELFPDIGLGVMLRTDGTVAVSAFISNVDNFPLGLYQYSITALSTKGQVVLDESGGFLVAKDTAGVNVFKPAVKPWDLLNPRKGRVTSGVRKERMDICRQCSEFKFGGCLMCGCVMAIKTTLSDAVCPKGAWGEVS